MPEFVVKLCTRQHSMIGPSQDCRTLSSYRIAAFRPMVLPCHGPTPTNGGYPKTPAMETGTCERLPHLNLSTRDLTQP